MVSLTFYGGVKEIGGNKILLQDGDTKIFLDFGMSFSKRGEFFEEFLTPRTANGIGDFLEMGLIPDIKGVYREDLLKHHGRKPEEPEIDGAADREEPRHAEGGGMQNSLRPFSKQ